MLNAAPAGEANYFLAITPACRSPRLFRLMRRIEGAEHRREIARERTLEAQLLAGHGMLEAEQGGVHGLALQAQDARGGGLGQGRGFPLEAAAVNRVADHGVPDVGEMHADLVGASRL